MIKTILIMLCLGLMFGCCREDTNGTYFYEDSIEVDSDKIGIKYDMPPPINPLIVSEGTVLIKQPHLEINKSEE